METTISGLGFRVPAQVWDPDLQFWPHTTLLNLLPLVLKPKPSDQIFALLYTIMSWEHLAVKGADSTSKGKD